MEPDAQPAAPIVEMRRLLAGEQDRLVELSEKSVQAISSLLTLSQWVLSVLAVIIALIAIFGWSVIRSAAIKRAEELANERMDTYIQSDEFRDLISQKIQTQLDKDWENRFVSPILDESDKQGAEMSPFPEAQKKGGAQ